MKLVETAARGVARVSTGRPVPDGHHRLLGKHQPPGAYHPVHHHPNNYLSGVYYVRIPPPGSLIIFPGPARPGLDDHAQSRGNTRGLTANGANAQSKEDGW